MPGKGFTLHMPSVKTNIAQDAEYCTIERDGEKRRLRFHDYDELYRIPGLYEEIFYERLQCVSPDVVVSLLLGEVVKDGQEVAEVAALDLGAGNGLVGEALRRRGARQVVGIDIIKEAAEAAERDRPGVYDAYFVEDVTRLSPASRRALDGYRFNAMTCVAALGFADIPPEAFAAAYNLVEKGGRVGFNLKQDFMDEEDSSGFSRLIRDISDGGAFAPDISVKYCHRYSVSGRPLYYVAVVGRKRHDISDEAIARSLRAERAGLHSPARGIAELRT